jgi:hypothetical protein
MLTQCTDVPKLRRTFGYAQNETALVPCIGLSGGRAHQLHLGGNLCRWLVVSMHSVHLLNTSLVREKYSAHGVDDEATAMDNTVSELVQKLYPSDVALPLGE